MTKTRNPLAITFDVWRAIFLREALDRLFDMRAAWFWLLMEPVMHIGFITALFTVVRLHKIAGADTAVWIIVGMLAFFLFRRTGIQVMYAVDCNSPMFAYRQVRPFDTAIVRGGLEGFLMVLVSAIILLTAAFLGHDVIPDDLIQTGIALLGLWLFGLGYGLVSSVLMALVPETEHILKILMMPLYLISGVIMPMGSVPLPYRDWLLLNPIANGLELVRQGYSQYYHMAPGASMSYLYLWALVSIMLGLMLYRRFDLKLVTQ
ncbi:ABC transporter permease [Leeia oryzae]|uniref:ABC transporter permease n=1 Tax=Leeia oryzae TaxID=356662 RepID=UPI00037D1095|nr:ABC transporter permease [Leeia oryzae]